MKNNLGEVLALFLGLSLISLSLWKIVNLVVSHNSSLKPLEIYAEFNCDTKPIITISPTNDLQSLIMSVSPPFLEPPFVGSPRNTCTRLRVVTFMQPKRYSISPESSWKNIHSYYVNFIESRENKWDFFPGKAFLIEMGNLSEQFHCFTMNLPGGIKKTSYESYTIALDLREESFFGLKDRQLESRLMEFPIEKVVRLEIQALDGYRLSSSIPPPTRIYHKKEFMPLPEVKRSQPFYVTYYYELERGKTDLTADFVAMHLSNKKDSWLIIWSTLLGLGLALIMEILVKKLFDK
ncbi:MAG: hypothetical protein MUE91_12550 [Ignavibacteriaceae bacterium]|nr:hypothetical protein [Ignavibacteriaceae bacterium]